MSRISGSSGRIEVQQPCDMRLKVWQMGWADMLILNKVDWPVAAKSGRSRIAVGVM